MVVERFDVFWVRLDPTEGREMRKTRPCVVVSPDEMNRNVDTVLVAPVTTTMKHYPTRVPVHVAGKQGEAALDQLRAVDKARLGRRLGRLDALAGRRLLAVLGEMFAP